MAFYTHKEETLLYEGMEIVSTEPLFSETQFS